MKRTPSQTRGGLSPRVRGNPAFGNATTEMFGSIPACAGEPDRPTADPSPPGSIPACAGEPSKAVPELAHVGVYPRVCGGTVLDFLIAYVDSGLSPRVRGNLCWASYEVGKPGSIPACAGEPRGLTPPYTWNRVYPRVCGGTDFMSFHPGLPPGLSPRVRGNLHNWSRAP